mgnify:CR=1 FL=1
MLEGKRLSAVVAGTPDEEVLRQLVSSEVLAHRTTPHFGVDSDEASFTYDTVFDYAVFRLLWRSATDNDVLASLKRCGTFAAGLEKSFRFLLEYREARHGVDAAIALGAGMYIDAEIEVGSRERLATEFAYWMSLKQSRIPSLVTARIRGVAGADQLLARVTSTRLRAA